MRPSALIERYRMALEVIADGPGYEFGPKVAKIALTDPWVSLEAMEIRADLEAAQERLSINEAVEQARAEVAEVVTPVNLMEPEPPCRHGLIHGNTGECSACGEQVQPPDEPEPEPDPDLPGTDGLSPLSLTILHTVRQHAEITAVDLKEWLPDDVSDQRRKKAIVALTERGLVVAEGSTKGRTYRAVVAPEVSQDKPTMPEEPASEKVADAGKTDGYTVAGMPIETAEVKRNGVGSDEGRLLESVRFKPNWSIAQHAGRLDLHQDRVSRAMRKLEEEGEVRSSPHGGRVAWNVR